MNATQEKIRKSSRIISIVLRIAEAAAIVGAILSAIGGIVLLCSRPDPVGQFVGGEGSTYVMMATFLTPVQLWLQGAAMVVNAVGCGQLYRIFRDISREGTPFANKHVRRIKTAAWLALPMSVLGGTVPMVPNVHLAMESGRKAMMIGIEPMWIVFGIVIYCLAYIFDYGCRLQQESDETL